jgi:hypothetical protein
MSQPLYLVITIDVEEEGLFSGRYPRAGAGVANVAELARLEFVHREFGFPLTLLATYPVARDPAAREVLISWQQARGAEIGVHLHPWNTPPFSELPDPEPIATARLPLALVEAKLKSLADCLTEGFAEPPRSFRMGRFDWSSELLELLPGCGLRVDSSMVPLTFKGEGHQNFLAPPGPFWLQAPASPGSGLLEAPVTMVPVLKNSAKAVHRLAGLLPGKAGQALRLAATLHRRRGGRVLTMFLHSSELLPGGSPDFPDAASVDHLVAKLRDFLSWLARQGPVTGLTLSNLYDLWSPGVEPPGR